MRAQFLWLVIYICTKAMRVKSKRGVRTAGGGAPPSAAAQE